VSLLRLGLATSLMFAGCVESPSPPDVGVAPGVTYEFVWSDAGAVSQSDGAWSVTSNLGYEVNVSLGLLTISTVQLIPCDDAMASVSEPWGVRMADWLLGASAARAGHGATETDPSAVLEEAIEALTPSGSVTLGPGEFDSHDYCGLHVLFGPSVTNPSPAQVDMVLHVLHLEGTWRRGEGEAESFVVHTALPTGALVDLEGPDGGALRIEALPWGARVQVERDLGGLFEDVDFETMSEESRDKTILTSLVDGLEARVVALSTEEPAS
jgi:hypothetical protein